MRNRRRVMPWALMVLGALLSLVALGMLSQTPDVLQYCAMPPEAGEKGENLRALAASSEKLGESLKDALAWTALGGGNGKVSLTVGKEDETVVNLIAMGEGWLEVYPRYLKQGRRIGESELAQGAKAAMVDERLAFRLFGEDLPEDAALKLNGVTFRVVGTVRHAGSVFGGRGVGDAVDYDVYVPLLAAATNGIPLETLTLSAVPRGGAGASQLFRESAEQWLAGGRLIDLEKEAMRRTILPRVLLLVVGMFALAGVFRWLTDVVMGWFGKFRDALKEKYFSALIGRLAGLIALTLLVYGALIAVTYALLAFSAQPLYVFTEWVPESIVEWSSIANVFWSLTADAAALVRIGTRELRVVEFWGGALRWGMVLILLGAALDRRGRRD